MFAAAATAVIVIAILSNALTGRAAVLLLDRDSPHFPYPFTIQNFEHLFFFLGSANCSCAGEWARAS
jgi:hypothetical protein